MSSDQGAQMTQSEVGNTGPPRALFVDDEERQDAKLTKIRSRSWFFTLNNPEPSDRAHLTQWFDTFTKKYVFQLEVGEECGTPHFQGVIYMKNAVSKSTMIQVAPRASWRVTRSWLRAVDYCSKQKTVVEGPWSKGVALREPIRLIQNLRPWQAEEVELMKLPPDDRTVRWVYDTAGLMGKTKFAIWCLHKIPGCVLISGKGPDMAMVLAEAHEQFDIKVVIFVYTREMSVRVSYSTIESVKDGLVFSGKFKSCVLNFNPPHVIVLSNNPPEYEKLSKDRWSVREIRDVSPHCGDQ